MTFDVDSWDDPIASEIYAEVVREGELYTRLAADLAELLDPADGALILDVASGSGLVSGAILSKIGADGRVVGLDRAHAMLAVARREHPVPTCAFLTGDPACITLASHLFDGATCSAALWHFPALGRFFRELQRVLRPGGRFVFNVPASQLRDMKDLPPAPLQMVLTRMGEKLFGHGPQPAGPTRHTRELLGLAAEEGFSLVAERQVDLPVSQQELLDLLSVRAISARLYPDVGESSLGEYLEQAAAAVDPDERVEVRWWEVLLETT